jgi:anti-sigma regulatory factor (Ser/Thr protein kinase)
MLNVIMQVPKLRAFSGQIYTILTELYNNALEHGILQLDSLAKDSTEGFSHYYQIREERLKQLVEGTIRFDLHYKGDVTGGSLIIDVQDSGSGFNHEALDFNIAGGDYSGRGVYLVAKLCSKFEYKTNGNEVRAIYCWGEGNHPVDE